MLVQPNGLTPEAALADRPVRAEGRAHPRLHRSRSPEIARVLAMGREPPTPTELKKLLDGWGIELDTDQGRSRHRAGAARAVRRRPGRQQASVTEYVAWLSLDKRALEANDSGRRRRRDAQHGQHGLAVGRGEVRAEAAADPADDRARRADRCRQGEHAARSAGAAARLSAGRQAARRSPAASPATSRPRSPTASRPPAPDEEGRPTTRRTARTRRTATPPRPRAEKKAAEKKAASQADAAAADHRQAQRHRRSPTPISCTTSSGSTSATSSASASRSRSPTTRCWSSTRSRT